MMKIIKSTNKTKKYMVLRKGKKTIHFGSASNQQFFDKLGKYRHLDHNDPIRRKSYLSRSAGIKNKAGELTKDNPAYANYWSRKYLW
tara:strand:+ start:662 stop:922 length:261 start_codon:yes stop_codon:yes gene_type:complete